MAKEKKTAKKRMPAKKKKPSFNVPNLKFRKQVKARWRKPRGTHNKKRMKKTFMGASPKIGYRNKKEVRGLHSSGKPEMLVNNLVELETLKGQDILVRFASALGKKKRKLMEAKAKELNLVILNLPHDGHAPKEGEKK
ncbi:MAG: eL32 family ribosomal protein [Candidatus Micrarchaeota archaeon]